MRAQGASMAGRGHRGSRRELGGRVLRYAAGSVVAASCSEAAFLLVYGPLHATPALAAGIGWLAGAVPNYWLNRSWTWRRTGRPSLTRELLPYASIVLGTLLLAVVATSIADAALTGGGASTGLRVGLVGVTFLGVYGVVFLLRFFLLDRLFRRAPAAPPAGGGSPASSTDSRARESV